MFASGELAAIGRAAASDNRGTGPLRQQLPQIHFAVDVVQTEFDQCDALFDQTPMFRDHILLPGVANADADHKEGLGSESYGITCGRLMHVKRATRDCTECRTRGALQD